MMAEFHCASPVCKAHIVDADKNELLTKVLAHVKTVHRIPNPTKSLVDYVVAKAVTD